VIDDQPTPRDFETFYDTTFTATMRRARALCGNKQDAEDLVADAYVEAFQRWHRIAAYEFLEGWMYQVMRQRFTKMRRRKARMAVVLKNLHIPAPPTVTQEADFNVVLAAVFGLPARQREVVIRFCFDDQPQDRIAEVMNIDRVTVAAHLRRARLTLIKVLGRTPAGQEPTDALVPAGAGSPKLDLTGEESLTVLLHDVAEALRYRYDRDWTARERIRARVQARVSRLAATGPGGGA
jgi:RNA polymerase sigma-70 factor (ECF subfamily)